MELENFISLDSELSTKSLTQPISLQMLCKYIVPDTQDRDDPCFNPKQVIIGVSRKRREKAFSRNSASLRRT